MNRFFKYLSLTIITISLFASTNTHCMRIKQLAKKPISLQFYSVDIKNDQTVKRNQATELERDRYEKARARELKCFLEIHDQNRKLNVIKETTRKSTTSKINPKALKSEITQVEARLHNLESGTLDIQNQYEELKSEIAQAESEVTQLQAASHDTWNQLDAIEKRIETLEFKIAWKNLRDALEDNERT